MKLEDYEPEAIMDLRVQAHGMGQEQVLEDLKKWAKWAQWPPVEQSSELLRRLEDGSWLKDDFRT